MSLREGAALETGYVVPVPRIERREALHYMGWHGAALDDALLGQMDRAEQQLTENVRPHLIARRFSLRNGCPDGTEYVPGGSDICELLAECHSVILMAATLGEAADRLIRRSMLQGGSQGFILDAAASAMIEAVCNAWENGLRKHVREENGYLTDRFSPGYGDMPLEDGRKICNILETGKKIGLTVSASNIMLPQKSVTALIGISDKIQKHRPAPCEVCSARGTCALAEGRNHR
ncbi:MAG: hypothetical protein IJ242_01795 [Clostridia bacterium]|nr:hypothetical protein [Clostridia bacterium]